MVSADDEIRTADRNENVDLFWAVRGGGDNYVNLQLAEDDSDRTAGAYRAISKGFDASRRNITRIITFA
jgi:hypothetical protein